MFETTFTSLRAVGVLMVDVATRFFSDVMICHSFDGSFDDFFFKQWDRCRRMLASCV